MSDPNSAPTGYEEIVQVLEQLPILVREKRRRDRLSMREAGLQMDVSFSTVHRCESGEDLVLSNAIKALRWIGGEESIQRATEAAKKALEEAARRDRDQ